MIVAKTIKEVRAAVSRALRAGRSVGFVPTMGALHAGHLSLVARARAACDVVVASIFVNPTQFGPGEDLDAYPRPIEADLAACDAGGVDVLFLPSPAEMYPPEVGQGGHDRGLTMVSVARLPDRLCGCHRVGHFDGVCTVVTKLLNIVNPTRAYFGEKDFQQATILCRLVQDLNLPVEMVVCPTVREADGLALSSRNAYLSTAERAQAPALHTAMQQIAQQAARGERSAETLVRILRDELAAQAPLGEVEYVQIVDGHSLEDLAQVAPGARVILAVRFPSARLIDNLALGI